MAGSGVPYGVENVHYHGLDCGRGRSTGNFKLPHKVSPPLPANDILHAMRCGGIHHGYIVQAIPGVCVRLHLPVLPNAPECARVYPLQGTCDGRAAGALCDVPHGAEYGAQRRPMRVYGIRRQHRLRTVSLCATILWRAGTLPRTWGRILCSSMIPSITTTPATAMIILSMPIVPIISIIRITLLHGVILYGDILPMCIPIMQTSMLAAMMMPIGDHHKTKGKGCWHGWGSWAWGRG